MINAGNPSVANLQMRKYVKEHKQSSSQIFEKLNRRGRLNPTQNAMSAQLTNEQLLRFYVKETVPKLQYNNDNIQGQGGDTNSVLMSEIQRLIDVGNFNAQDAKGNMTTMQNSLIANNNLRHNNLTTDMNIRHNIIMEDAKNRHTNLIQHLQVGFGSVNDSIADNLSNVKTTIDDIVDNFAIYASTNDASSQNIIKSLNDLNTNLEQYNTTGTVSQGALFTSLANLQTALANSNTNNAANTAAIDNLSIIMGSMSGTPGVGTTPATPATPTAPVLPPAPAAPVLPPAPASPVLPPAPASPVLPPRPNTPPPPPFTPITSVLHAAIGGLGGSSTTTTDPATGITTTNVVVPPIAPTAQQQADATAAKGGAGSSVMVTGPKISVSVGNYPEYDEIKAKNGGKDLIMKDYRDILIKVAQDYPHLFPGTQKASTYINSRSKPELHALSEKILKEKYAYIDEQNQSANLIQNILRGHRGRGVVTGIHAERATAADIVIKKMRGYHQQDKFRDIITRGTNVLQQRNQDRSQMRNLFQDYRQQRNQQEAFRRAIFEQNTSYLGGRDPYFEP